MSETAAVSNLFVKEIRARLYESHQRIVHCVRQLNGQQLWWRPQDEMNSIANILLHLCGNLRQWIINGLTGSSDSRNRSEEFTDRSGCAKSELMDRLEVVVMEADCVLSELNVGQLLDARRIQGFNETVMSAILNSVTHFNGHTQEIVYITRLQLGASYNYAWTPETQQ